MTNILMDGATLFLLLVASYLLTVRTWHQMSKTEDYIGKFDQKLDRVIDALNRPDETPKELLSRQVMAIAAVLSNKIKQDNRFVKDEIKRAKIGVVLVLLATSLQIVRLFVSR